jgi:hypothetical protein
LIFILTKDDEAFGLYLDDIMRLKLKDYRGEFENFLFSSIRASFNTYKPTSYNPKDFKNEDKFFDIGPCSLTRSNLKLTGGL